MDPKKETSDALLSMGTIGRVKESVDLLHKRFESILAFAPERDYDRTTAAVSSYRLEVESAAMVREAENFLTISREIKEAWLFGKLQTVGSSEAEKRAEEAARNVAEMLSKAQNDSNREEIADGDHMETNGTDVAGKANGEDQGENGSK